MSIESKKNAYSRNNYNLSKNNESTSLDSLQEKIEIADILIDAAEEGRLFADIHPLPWHQMRETLHVSEPIVYRPHRISFPMRVGDSGLLERLLQKAVKGYVFYKGLHTRWIR